MGGARKQALGSRLLRFALGALAAGFVVVVGVDLFRKFEPGRISIDARWLLLSVALGCGALFCQLAAWRGLIEKFSGSRVPLLPAAVLYLDSQMARYTPGKLGLVAVRVTGAADLGVPARILASTLLVELASWTAVGLLVGAGTLVALSVADPRLLPASVAGGLSGALQLGSGLLALGALVGTVLLCTVGRQHFPVVLTRLLLGPLADDQRGRVPLAPVGLPLWHLAHWTLWVASGGCLGLSVQAPPLVAIAVGASLCVAIVLGFLAVVAPAGAGVREAVLAALLAPSLGPAIALSLGLLARAVALLAEVVLWLGARIAHLRWRRGR